MMEILPFEYVEKLRMHADDTVRYFGNERKAERERDVCRAFLRCVGITFVEQEMIAPSEEPVDVSFRDARFQVREVLEEGRRRGDEWKCKRDRWHRAQSIDDVTEPVVSSVPMTFSELVERVTDELGKKAKKYGGQCSDIDALVYVNLIRHLYPLSSSEDLHNLEEQGWRSVCVLFPPYGVVLFAREAAPHFLFELTGKILHEWGRPDGLFCP